MYEEHMLHCFLLFRAWSVIGNYIFFGTPELRAFKGGELERGLELVLSYNDMSNKIMLNPAKNIIH